MTHLIDSFVHCLDDRRSDRLSHITDTKADDLLFRMLCLECGYSLRNICEQIAARQFGKIFIDFKHGLNPLFLSVNAFRIFFMNKYTTQMQELR